MIQERWRIEMLGGLTLRRSDRTITRFSTRKAAALLARLAFYPDRPQTRDELVDLLWPDSDIEAGRMSLRTALSSLRRQLELPGTQPGEVLQTDRTHVVLRSDAVVSDVAEFQEMLRLGSATAGPDPVSHLKRAVELYQGELLPGLYDEWVLSERTRLAEGYTGALRRLVSHYEDAGEPENAIDYALRLAQADPLEEEPRARLMHLFAATGRPSLAVKQFEEYRRLLKAEMNEEPSPSLQALARQVGAGGGEANVRAPSKPSATDPEAKPNRLPQGLKATNTTAIDRSSESPPRLYLPLTLNGFFGRSEEIERITELLSACAADSGSAAARLVTLTGPGGAGKTRLSLEVCRRLREGTFSVIAFVPLGDLPRAAQIPDVTARTLRIPASPSLEPMEQIVSALNEEKRCLLVLDNFEHIAEEGARVVLTLLQRIPGLSLLITSRRKLGLAGEREAPLSPLPSPTDSASPAELLRFPSVQLFTDRAQAVRPDFQLTARNAGAVAEICRRLDGLPLAIELAAARSLAMPPSQILERLTERFELLTNRRTDKASRHRSLWAAIDWSYGLLSPELQRLFCRLSVFRGGCTSESAAAVCDEPSALEYLTQLRERSLLVAEARDEEMRFRMLESLREYAAEQLDEEEQRSLSEAHVRCFTSLAEEAEPLIRSAEQATWLSRLDAEQDNLRAAMQFDLESGTEGTNALRIAGALSHYWWTRGTVREGRRILEAVLAAPGAAARDANRARALNGLGVMCLQQQDTATARTSYEECLAIRRELGDEKGIAASLNNIGDILRFEWDLTRARSYYEEALGINVRLGNRLFEAINCTNLGSIACRQGRFSASEELLMHALQIFKELELTQGIGYSTLELADLYSQMGEHQKSRDYYLEMKRLSEEIGNRAWECSCLNGLGNASLRLGEVEEAGDYFRSALQSAQETGDGNNLSYSHIGLARIARLEGNPVTARKHLTECFDIVAVSEDHGLIPPILEEAALQIAAGDPHHAVLLIAASQSHREELGLQQAMANHAAMEALQHELAAVLPPADYTSAWTEGLHLNRSDSVQLALSVLSAK